MDEINILLAPGGMGTRRLVSDASFLSALKGVAESAAYCLTVCTGPALLARTGLPDGRRATSNKKAFSWVTSQSGNVSWVGTARWVRDGKPYTASGVSAGIDMAFGFVGDRRGREEAPRVARDIEYRWNEDQEFDPFSVETSRWPPRRFLGRAFIVRGHSASCRNRERISCASSGESSRSACVARRRMASGSMA